MEPLLAGEDGWGRKNHLWSITGSGVSPWFVSILKILILRVGLEFIRWAVGIPVFVFKGRFTYYSRLESFIIFCTCCPLHDGIWYACKAGQCARPNSFFMGFPKILLLLRSWQLLKLGSCGHATQICEYMPYLYGGYWWFNDLSVRLVAHGQVPDSLIIRTLFILIGAHQAKASFWLLVSDC